MAANPDNKPSGLRALERGMAEKTGLPPDEARDMIDQIADLLFDALAAGEPVKMYGFGSFFFEDVPACQMWNPAQGGFRQIAARRNIVFRPSEYMQAKLNKRPMQVWSSGMVRPRKYDPARDEP